MRRYSFTMELEVEDGWRKWWHDREGLDVSPAEWDHDVVGGRSACPERWIEHVALERALFVAASNQEEPYSEKWGEQFHIDAPFHE
jgi:hypothetical protein